MRFRRRRRPVPTVAITADDLVPAGGRAHVAVTIDGEDDGTFASVEVYLRLLGWESARPMRWPLGEVPAALGTHELEVELPAGLAPACTRLTEYAVCAGLRRTGERGVTAAAAVDVIGDVVHWPEDRHTGVPVEEDAVPLGGTVRGSADAPVEFGPVMLRRGGRRFKALATAEAGAVRARRPGARPADAARRRRDRHHLGGPGGRRADDGGGARPGGPRRAP